MINISTPVSTFFNDYKFAEMIMKHSDSLEGRPFNVDKNFRMRQETFHCDVVQPIHKMKRSEFDFIEKIVETKPGLNVISFHCATSAKNIIEKNGIYQTSDEKYSKQEMYDNCFENVEKIRSIVGNIELLIENNAYYPTNAYDYVTDGRFLSKLIFDTGLDGFLFDTAHAQVTAYNKGITYEEYKSTLPFELCRQIQVCKMGYEGDYAKDLHKCPDEIEFQDVKSLIDKWSNIGYVTVEYYRDINKLIKSLKELRTILND
jgi:uncharacterized protein (UPF0276 family)